MIESNLQDEALFMSVANNNKTNAYSLGIATYLHYKHNNFCYSDDLKPMYLKKSSAEQL